jgi:hypothetical protein
LYAWLFQTLPAKLPASISSQAISHKVNVFSSVQLALLFGLYWKKMYKQIAYYCELQENTGK